jgi:hypothetical protein
VLSTTGACQVSGFHTRPPADARDIAPPVAESRFDASCTVHAAMAAKQPPTTYAARSLRIDRPIN